MESFKYSGAQIYKDIKILTKKKFEEMETSVNRVALLQSLILIVATLVIMMLFVKMIDSYL